MFRLGWTAGHVHPDQVGDAMVQWLPYALADCNGSSHMSRFSSSCGDELHGALLLVRCSKRRALQQRPSIQGCYDWPKWQLNAYWGCRLSPYICFAWSEAWQVCQTTCHGFFQILSYAAACRADRQVSAFWPQGCDVQQYNLIIRCLRYREIETDKFHLVVSHFA